MITDTVLREKGMAVLVENLGIIEAERFIMLMNREPFNYTKWQEHLWEDKTVEEIHNAATQFYQKLEASNK
jgi:hypothetical protein